MSPDAGALDRVAESVADGAAVDWHHVESDVAVPERRLIRHLRLVESIASLYRSIPDLDETADESIPSGPRWGRLVLLERIGQGTSCDVHRAFDTDLHRYVALKLLHDDGIAGRGAHERMLQEARRLARVQHRHVVQVFGAEQHLDRVGLWMELVEGESLDQIVRTRGNFGAREASGIGQDICSALAAVHGAGLLHRDVKAQNVLRESGGRIVLMDFGTGEELRNQSGTARLVGTPLYLAPELFQGQPASVQSDLYSVGVLLFYLVTGQFPVAAATMPQLEAAQGSGRVRRLRDVRSDLPAPFVAVVDRALAPDLAARYHSAGELEAALRDLPAGFQPSPVVRDVAVVKPVPVPVPFTRRSAMIGAIAAMLLLMSGLIASLRVAPPPALASTGPTRIAILPFRDLSPTPTPYLADALTDQLTATLGQIHTLRVIAPASAATFRDSAVPAAEIARQLGVDAVVESTVSSSPPAAPNEPLRARVESRIVRAAGGSPLSTGVIDWVAGDSRALQAGLTRAIAKAVNAAVTPAEADRIMGRQSNPNAEEAYLRGRADLMTYGGEGARLALAEFKRALAFDPNYAVAYAGASRAYVTLGQFGIISDGEARQSALAAAGAALERDDEMAEGHLAMADLKFFYDWDWAGAEREYLKALELNPSLSRARRAYAELLAVVHRFPEANKEAEMARSLDPQTAETSLTHAVVLLYGREFDKARAVVEETSRQEPESAAVFLMRGRIAEAEGRYPEALASVQHASKLPRGNALGMQLTLLQLVARSGRQDEARAGLAAFEQQAAAGTIRLTHRDRAYMRLALGDEAGALDEFDKSFAERETTLRWISVDPRLDSLRGNSRFTALLTRMGLS